MPRSTITTDQIPAAIKLLSTYLIQLDKDRDRLPSRLEAARLVTDTDVYIQDAFGRDNPEAKDFQASMDWFNIDSGDPEGAFRHFNDGFNRVFLTVALAVQRLADALVDGSSPAKSDKILPA